MNLKFSYHHILIRALTVLFMLLTFFASLSQASSQIEKYPSGSIDVYQEQVSQAKYENLNSLFRAAKPHERGRTGAFLALLTLGIGITAAFIKFRNRLHHRRRK